MRVLALVFSCVLLAGEGTRAAQTPPASVGTGGGGDYVFGAATGLLVFHVRPDLAADFEAVMGRISQGLEVATDSVRRQQREAWRFLRSRESTPAGAVYVVLVDPVTPGADYDPVRMITELLPGEAQELYSRLKAAVMKVERLSLERVGLR